MRSTTLVAALAASLAACGSGPEDATAIDDRFVRFRLATVVGPCPPGRSCGSSLAFDASGRLERGEGASIRTAQASPADLAAAIRVVTAPGFLALLGTPAPCQGVTDGFETMELDFGGSLKTDPTTACRTEAPISAVRTEMRRLTVAYFP
jgi:hypothetical protein